ncbi:MAG TPA: hypothetical protein VEK77_09090 [Gemmatimonadales bacterium]|nr:hypothetical protein [Gemmatimonadales bacterium]
MTMRRLWAIAILVALHGCATATWTELGPMYAGRVSAIAATDVNHVWVATPGGGVWKSGDGGTTFAWAGNYGLGDFTAVHLAVDRNDASRLILRTWSGVLVSTDGGAHWTRALYSIPQGDTPYPYPAYFCSSWPACPPFVSVWGEPGPYAQMVFSPTESIIVTALPCQGLQYSTNSGASFTQLWPFTGSMPLQRNPDNCVSAIAADEVTHQIWIATMASATTTHIYRSQPWTAAGPSGPTWDLVNSGITATQPAIALAWGGTANRLMALVGVSGGYQALLYNGTSWAAKLIGSAGCFFGDARALVWGGGNDFFAGGVTFAYTNDAGDHWTCPALGMQYVDIRAIFASPAAHSLWIGGDQNQLGNYRLMTRYTWNPGSAPSAPVGITGSGIRSWQSYSIAQAQGTNRLILGAQDIGPVCSDDGGASWRLTGGDEAQGVVWSRGGAGDTVYAYSTMGTLWRSTNARSATSCAGVSFSNVSPPDALRRGQPLTGPHSVAVHPIDARKIFTLSGGTVVYSLGGGMPATSWSASAVPLTVAGRPVGLTAVMVDEDGVVYVGTQDNGAYTCSDTVHYCDGTMGAGTWTPFGLNPGSGVTPPAFISAIAESNPPPAPRNFWVGTSQGVYRRLAGSVAWTAVDAVNLYPYSDVTVDPTCRTRIYTAIGYLANVTRTRGGIHVSTDNGATWTSITSGFPLHNVPVTQVLVDGANPARVFAATYGRGAWTYNWSSLSGCAP